MDALKTIHHPGHSSFGSPGRLSPLHIVCARAANLHSPLSCPPDIVPPAPFSSPPELKGFWVKAGQYISSRADAVPKTWIEQLGVLQDAMPDSSVSEINNVIRRELGQGRGLLCVCVCARAFVCKGLVRG